MFTMISGSPAGLKDVLFLVDGTKIILRRKQRINNPENVVVVALDYSFKADDSFSTSNGLEGLQL